MTQILIKNIPQIENQLEQIITEVIHRPISRMIVNPRVPGQHLGEVRQNPESEYKSLKFDLNNDLHVDIHQSGIVKYDIELTYQKKSVNLATQEKKVRDLLKQIEIEFLKKV